MKKAISILVLLFSFLSIHAAPAEKVNELILENGMSVFLLPDSSSALIKIELSVKAGFSSQNRETNGFFKLYSRLIQNYSSDITFSSVLCNADSTRYTLFIPPEILNNTLDTLSQAVFSNNFSDDLISSQLNLLKNEVSALAQDSGTLLNAGIDSKVFSDSPWKHDSGIYAPVFKKNTLAQTRAIVKKISDNWYTPQNCGIFITGNFNQEQILDILNSTFGKYYSTTGIPLTKSSIPVNPQRKYVIHDSDFSSEISQIVIQYTMLNMDECNIAATLFNNDNSTLKSKLSELQELNIPGNEYINISAASKKNSSRLIIQALLQTPENKKNQITTLNQSELFFKTVKENIKSINSQELNYARSILAYNQKNILSNSQTFMDNLCSFWAIQNYTELHEQSITTSYDSPTVNLFCAQFEKAKNISGEELQSILSAEDPFIFVIINSADFKKNRKSYMDAGFEEINSKNASWYVQEFYKEIRNQKESDENPPQHISSQMDYYSENINTINTTKLNNGIEVSAKKNPDTSTVTILLSISGGKYKSRANHGFEEVMINLLATNIRKEIYRQQLSGIILGTPEVSFESHLKTSSIIIECEKEDFEACCVSISNALIYDDITPAQADRAVSARQYKKRLENGTALNQLMDSAIKTLYKNTQIPALFDSEKEVLEKIDYTEIQSNYPELLNASRYKLILTGNFAENYEESLNNSIGLLSSHNLSNHEEKLPSPVYPSKKTLKTKIRHTFLTDIPAEKAGPMPAVLIPTTEFLDPLLYLVKLPEDDVQQIQFEAILYYFQNIFQEELKKNGKTSECTVTILKPQTDMDFATIAVQNVRNKKEVDSVYKKAYKAVSERLDINTGISESLMREIQKIKTVWMINELNVTSSNTGTAKLMQIGFEKNKTADFYLDEYKIIKNSNAMDFAAIVPYLETPALTVQSE